MESEVHESGPIQNFIASLYSGAFYNVAPGLGLGAGIRNLLILVTLLGFITAVRLSLTVGTFFDGWREGVEAGRIPVLHFEKDRLRVEGPQPYVAIGPNGLMAIIDTTGQHVTLPDSAVGGVFLGRGTGFYRSWGKTPQPIVYNFEAPGYHLDAAGVARMRQSMLPLAVIVGWGILAFYFLVGNTLLGFLLAGPGYWFGRRWRPDLRYVQVLTLAFFVLTPVALLFLLVGLIQPMVAFGLWPLYPALAASTLMSRLRRWVLPAPPGGGGAAGREP